MGKLNCNASPDHHLNLQQQTVPRSRPVGSEMQLYDFRTWPSSWHIIAHSASSLHPSPRIVQPLNCEYATNPHRIKRIRQKPPKKKKQWQRHIDTRQTLELIRIRTGGYDDEGEENESEQHCGAARCHCFRCGFLIVHERGGRLASK